MKGIWTILYRPRETFEGIRGGGSWIVALMVLLLLYAAGILMSFTMMFQINEPSLMPIARKGGFDEFFPFIIALLAAVGLLLCIFIGGFFLLLVNLLVRGEARYSDLVKVIVFSSVPIVIQQLLSPIFLLFARETVNDWPESYIGSVGWVIVMVITLSMTFSIWSLVLNIIGTVVMTRRTKAKVGGWIVGLSVLMFAVIFAGGILR